MDDLVAWLTHILDEREQFAKRAGGDRWILDGGIYHESHPSDEVVDWVYDDASEHIAANDPASVLARIAADRQIVARYQRALDTYRDHLDDLSSAGAVLALRGVVELLAGAIRRDTAEEWRPVERQQSGKSTAQVETSEDT